MEKNGFIYISNGYKIGMIQNCCKKTKKIYFAVSRKHIVGLTML